MQTETKTHKVTVKFPESDYILIKEEAKNCNSTMADLLRDGWYDKQNSLVIFEEFDRRIKIMESSINEKNQNLEQLFKSNDSKLVAIYKVLKGLTFPADNQEKRHD
jgi:hypothetical protein